MGQVVSLPVIYLDIAFTDAANLAKGATSGYLASGFSQDTKIEPS